MSEDRAGSPDWTHFNRSDPGVTLLELFSYLGEMLAFYQERTAAEAHLVTRRRHVLLLGAASAAFVICWRCRKVMRRECRAQWRTSSSGSST
jgi:hypothetical protein